MIFERKGSHIMTKKCFPKSLSFNIIPVLNPCYNELINNKVVIAMNPELLQLATRLADVTVRNSATVVFKKIDASKARKNDKQTIYELTDIINELIDEKQELQQIAKAFEQELTAEKLSEKDIEFVEKTVLPVIKEFAAKNDDNEFLENIEKIEPLISQNTIKVLQIFGFNFKKAIGEPFTELLIKKINSLSLENNSELMLATVQRDNELYKLLQNEDAYNRLQELSNMNGY